MALEKYLRIDFNKNTKAIYYLTNIARMMVPGIYYERRLKALLLSSALKEDEVYIKTRVDYYNKLDEDFVFNENVKTIQEFKKEKKRVYFFDLLEYLRYFEKKLKISYLFGDIIHIPNEPTLLKSRPIDGNNANSILLKLDKVRHFIFVNDKIAFEDKKNLLVWRGKCFTQPRRDFLSLFHDNPFCNVGQINESENSEWIKPKMKLREHFNYKFILSIEGNDVASNLKWVMSSNSIAFMVKPTYETWFMEGRLIPNYHYVLLKDDYSDLEEKIAYYSTHIDESKEIIKNAHKYIEQFKNKKRENIISLAVLDKYFDKNKTI